MRLMQLERRWLQSYAPGQAILTPLPPWYTIPGMVPWDIAGERFQPPSCKVPGVPPAHQTNASSCRSFSSLLRAEGKLSGTALCEQTNLSNVAMRSRTSVECYPSKGETRFVVSDLCENRKKEPMDSSTNEASESLSRPFGNICRSDTTSWSRGVWH